MLENIRLLLGLTSTDNKDSLLLLLINLVQEEVRNFIHDNCLAGLEDVISQMVIYRYNRLGTEGVDGENYSGVSFSYSTDYPESILRQLRAHRKIGVIRD